MSAMNVNNSCTSLNPNSLKFFLQTPIRIDAKSLVPEELSSINVNKELTSLLWASAWLKGFVVEGGVKG
jgi:hypothetical protein